RKVERQLAVLFLLVDLPQRDVGLEAGRGRRAPRGDVLVVVAAPGQGGEADSEKKRPQGEAGAHDRSLRVRVRKCPDKSVRVALGVPAARTADSPRVARGGWASVIHHLRERGP